MVRCSVKGCKSDSHTKMPDLSFHSFPEDDNLRQKWIVATGRTDWTPKLSSRICSRHFEKKMLNKKKKLTLLLPDAVPFPLEKDMANYCKYKMGFSQKVLMVDGAVPSKFHCQEAPVKRISHPSRKAFVKHRRPQPIQEREDIQPSATMEDDLSETPAPRDVPAIQDDVRTNMDNPISPDQSIHCINCGTDVTHKRKHTLNLVEVRHVILQWIAPQPVQAHDQICHSCWAVALNASNVSKPSQEPSTGSGSSHRRQLCVCCRISLLKLRTHSVNTESERERCVRNVVMQWIYPVELTASDRICHPCWQKADRRANRNVEKDETTDSITSPGASQLDEDKVTGTPPQISKDAPMEIIECAYSSSTESALSDTEDLSTLTPEEQKSLNNDDVPKSRSEQASVESTAAVQYSELNRTEELELDEEVQPRANKHVRGRKRKRLVKKNTETSDEIKRKEETVERYKGYTIIANVYHYLKKEYESLKSQLGGRCDLSPLANILKRTAAATGVAQRVVNAALHTHKLKTSIRSDHSYNRSNTRTNTACSKSKKAGTIVSLHRKGRTQNYKRRTNKQQDDESDGEGVRPPKPRTAPTGLKSKHTIEKHLPLNITAVYSYNTQRKDTAPSYKWRTNNNKRSHDSEGERVRPPKRRSARIGVRNTPSNEEQLPFPSPIQFRPPGVMETQFKAEPADDECQQTLENDPLGPVSQFPINCRTPEATETEFKAEPADDECLQKSETDPLETESTPAALEEPSDPSDASEIEMKFEQVDEEYPELCTDYSVCDPALLDIKPEPPSE